MKGVWHLIIFHPLYNTERRKDATTSIESTKAARTTVLLSVLGVAVIIIIDAVCPSLCRLLLHHRNIALHCMQCTAYHPPHSPRPDLVSLPLSLSLPLFHH